MWNVASRAARGSLILVVAIHLLPLPHAAPPQSSGTWYKGNTHAHTGPPGAAPRPANTDGDSPPEAVVRWYKDHGYAFLFITDHELITDAAALNNLFAVAGKFTLISGQEVTQQVADARASGPRDAHVNALGITQLILPMGTNKIATGVTVADTYKRNLELIRRAGGLPQVNHPNFRWSVPLADMIDLPDSTLFEVWNGNPNVYNNGGTDSTGREWPSTEARWDSLLTRGRLIFGVADDDSHSFRPEAADSADVPRPGRGWVMVRADTLTPAAILSGLRRGDFYASNGVTLGEYRSDKTQIQLTVVPIRDRQYVTEFIGNGGKILASVRGLKARYEIKGTEGYVRARVTDSAGRKAWMQPVWLKN